ncbi:hypothetical protein LTR10_019823 [Elasticomyces elasticus]|uniref:Prostatic spermine-binding protein-like n=1 Tax=Exophiala sideris TaxID=1016849 RepID=A0ABR0J1L4_9EURO|nr:hypothetical protein LTR10_019823 [Elasticomyces elasticus]KAK5024407.1 hypothetical protein LTS07_008698 [Exophiala sideris]KAK5030911.1 hypothetical protein LTR13_007924 [Exophiala sideris]KAK5054140.1 hypothetical protein LTR69_009102 [Exophiala sideris]KAK5179504.1 hypothetical protein LTR44_008020 [Eurotiomycetes sp. CCFEE 6388]
MDPDLCGDSDDEDEILGIDGENDEGWDESKDGQENVGYDHDNWNDDGQDDQDGQNGQNGQNGQDDYDEATYSDGGDDDEGHQDGSHHGQHHGQSEDDY